MKTDTSLCSREIRWIFSLVLLTIFASANAQSPIRLHPDNPHYFQYNGKPVLLITSAEHYGALINLDFDYIPYLDALRAQGLNNTRVFTGTYVEREKDIKWMGYNNTLAPRPGRLIVPWARSKVNGYFGGGNKFDLDKWDENYFNRLKDLITQASARGIFVELTLFGNQYKDSIWMNSPLYPGNNIQNVGPSGPKSFLKFQTLQDEKLLARQDEFVIKVLHELNYFDNLYFEICNEPYNEVTDSVAVIEWHNHMVTLITQVEASLPKKHLIATNQSVVYNSNVSVANYHYIKIPHKPSDRWLYDLNKVNSMDETMGSLIHSDVNDVRVEAWDFILRGGGAYNNLSWEYTPLNESGSDSARIIRKQLENLQKFMRKVDYLKMTPDKSTVIKVPDGAFLCVLSEKGKQYAFYLHHSKPKGEDAIWGYDAIEKSFRDTLSLTVPSGKYALKFFNPSTGELIKEVDTVEYTCDKSIMCLPPFITDIAFILSIAQPNVKLSQNTLPDTNLKVIVDCYGQLKAANFRTKILNDHELLEDVIADKSYYGSLTPPVRDIYGGLPGSKEQFQLSATGFFHIEKLTNGQTIMADPLGNIFFSLGVNGVGYAGDTYTHIRGREKIYEWLPQYITNINSSDYQFNTAFLDNSSDNFSFYVTNKIRKTNKPFNNVKFYDESVTRMKKWGFTSEGGFSITPHTSLKENIFPQVRFADLPERDMIPDAALFDIFKPSVPADIHAEFEKQGIGSHASDPLIIGYFFGNEFEYHRLKNIIPAKKASEVASKGALIIFLKDRYKNDVALFNKAWGTSYTRFDELYEAILNVTSNEALQDMSSFTEIFLDKYYSVVSAEFRKIDTNHMLIGDRYFTAAMNDENLRNIICKVAGKYLDVLSYNYYTYDVDLDRLKSMHKISGKPIIITEFHYGEPTQGQTSAIQMVDNEQEKGYAYRNFVEKIAATGFVVGAHWFEYLDQSVTGRWFQGYNGESFAIGLVNVTDRPYKEFLTSIMKCNYSIYDLMLGNKQPYSYDFGPGRTGRNIKNTIAITKTNDPLIIDGIKDATWPQGDTILLEDKDRVTGIKQDNAFADISLAWDNSNLYVFVHIGDLTPAANGFKGEDIWNGDAVELFIGPDNVEQGGAIQPKDAQIVLGASSDSQPHFYWFNGAVEQPRINMVVRMDDNHKGYSIEAAVPMEKLNITNISEDRQIRFDIGFDAGDERQRNSQYMWNGEETNSQSRTKWGIVKLAGTARH